jgi:hypothetical protein
MQFAKLNRGATSSNIAEIELTMRDHTGKKLFKFLGTSSYLKNWSKHKLGDLENSRIDELMNSRVN